jgi:glycine C-acetyltransferase
MQNSKEIFLTELKSIKESGLYKEERIIVSPQSSHIKVSTGKSVINMCANNYLGLSNHPALLKAGKEGLEKWGFGLSSVRFICGTQDIHKQLESSISNFLQTDDTILYSSCFDANGGLFETLLNDQDAIISDELNHASIIDGVRLCKATRYRYKNCNMVDLEDKLKEASNARIKMIATDGVFSMDGSIAPLDKIVGLAEKYQAMVMIDDSHAVGFIGKTGRGTHEYNNVMGKIDIITGTLGKALGGASGGYTSGRKEIIDLLRQRSRPYLFSNTLAPVVAAASLAAIELISKSTELRDRLEKNALWFRNKMKEHQFDIPDGVHPIVPVFLYKAELAQKVARKLLEKGIYAIGFFYPVVPKEKARIRIQVSAAHSMEDLKEAVNAFVTTRNEMKASGDW